MRNLWQERAILGKSKVDGAFFIIVRFAYNEMRRVWRDKQKLTLGNGYFFIFDFVLLTARAYNMHLVKGMVMHGAQGGCLIGRNVQILDVAFRDAKSLKRMLPDIGKGIAFLK